MFSTRRLKKKSQSVDISSPGYNPLSDIPAPHTSRLPPITKTISEEEHNNTTNTQKRNPRRGDLKRGYTIDQLDLPH